MKTIATWMTMLLVIVSLTQCNKASNEEDPTPAPGVTKTELLAGTSTRAWVMTSLKFDGKESFGQSIICSKDDNTVYRTDKTYEVNEGESKCRSDGEQVYEKGTWAFNGDESELIINNTDRYKVLELNNTTLRLSIKTLFGETVETTYKKKAT